MQRCDLGRSLSDGCLHDIGIRCIGTDLKLTLIIGKRHRQLLVEQQAVQRIIELYPVKLHTDIHKRRIAGFRKGFREVFKTMHRSVVTADRILSGTVSAIALVGVLPITVRILAHIFQRSNNLKSRPRRI